MLICWPPFSCASQGQGRLDSRRHRPLRKLHHPRQFLPRSCTLPPSNPLTCSVAFHLQTWVAFALVTLSIVPYIISFVLSALTCPVHTVANS